MELRKEQRAQAAASEKDNPPIVVAISGQVESGHLRGYEFLECSYQFQSGPDWKLRSADSQMDSLVPPPESEPLKSTRKSLNVPCHDGASVVWNFPISATYTTTNPYGWPRLIITLTDAASGNDRGYGSVLVPTRAGKYTRYIRMFTPLGSSPIQDFLGWLINSPPEFIRPAFVAEGSDREVTRVQSSGVVKVTLIVSTKDMTRYGYSEGPRILTLG